MPTKIKMIAVRAAVVGVVRVRTQVSCLMEERALDLQSAMCLVLQTTCLTFSLIVDASKLTSSLYNALEMIPPLR